LAGSSGRKRKGEKGRERERWKKRERERVSNDSGSRERQWEGGRLIYALINHVIVMMLVMFRFAFSTALESRD
jgi:hypothetical protein